MRSFPRASSASEVLSIFISSLLHHSTKVNRCRHEIGRHWGESRWPPLGERRRWAVVVDGEGFGPARFGSVKLTLLSLFTRTRSSQLTAFLECMALAHCAHRRARERESRSDRRVRARKTEARSRALTVESGLADGGGFGVATKAPSRFPAQVSRNARAFLENRKLRAHISRRPGWRTSWSLARGGA